VNESTQVGIVGARPSGLLLSQLLSQHGIDNIVVEAAAARRIRPGVACGAGCSWSRATVDLLIKPASVRASSATGWCTTASRSPSPAGASVIDVRKYGGSAITV